MGRKQAETPTPLHNHPGCFDFPTEVAVGYLTSAVQLMS